MTDPASKHELVTKAVEKELRRIAGDVFDAPLLEGCIQMWYDFAEQTDLRRTRKPEAWAAGAFYAFDRMSCGEGSQESAADLFKVNKNSVATKYRQLAQTLDLKLLDERYIPEKSRYSILDSLAHIPIDIPLLNAPTTFWPFPLLFGEAGDFDSMQDQVYDGWNSMASDPQVARFHFEQALKLDPALADAHNGLGDLSLLENDLASAEMHFQKAYELAKQELGSESPDAYYWWGELETRPYMRARQGLASAYWEMGRFKDAISEYEALLRLNPNDNQGVRFVLAPLYHLSGDLEGALEAFNRYQDEYPDDFDDPWYSFSYGLALYASGQKEQAVQAWYSAVFVNIYLAPLLLEEPLPDTEFWHGTNLQEPGYAGEYVELFGDLWKRTPGALDVVRRLWCDEALQSGVTQYVHLSKKLDPRGETIDFEDEKVTDERMKVVEKLFALGASPFPEESARRILEG